MSEKQWTYLILILHLKTKINGRTEGLCSVCLFRTQYIVARRLSYSISLADDFEKTGFEVCAKSDLTFCLQAFSDSSSLINKNATNLKVKFLYCCVINSGDLDTFVKYL